MELVAEGIVVVLGGGVWACGATEGIVVVRGGGVWACGATEGIVVVLGAGVWARGVLIPATAYSSGTSKLSQSIPAVVGSHGMW